MASSKEGFGGCCLAVPRLLPSFCRWLKGLPVWGRRRCPRGVQRAECAAHLACDVAQRGRPGEHHIDIGPRRLSSTGWASRRFLVLRQSVSAFPAPWSPTEFRVTGSLLAPRVPPAFWLSQMDFNCVATFCCAFEIVLIL